MKRYAFIEENEIKFGPVRVPKAWRNISGFDHLTDQELKTHGWIPWELIEIDIGPTEVYTNPIIQIHEDKVTETQTKREKTEQELLQELEDKKHEVRYVRNQKLQDTDWIIVRALETNTNIDEWKTYRQQLRDITEQPNFPDVEWPEKP